ALRAMVRAYPGSSVVQTQPDWSSYLIPQGQAPAPSAEASGTPLRIKAVGASVSKAPAERAIDGDRETSWSSGSQESTADFTVELDQASRVAQIVMDLGHYPADFPARL